MFSDLCGIRCWDTSVRREEIQAAWGEIYQSGTMIFFKECVGLFREFLACVLGRLRVVADYRRFLVDF